MIMRSLQPSYARHLMGVPIMDYKALIEALYGIEDRMARGLWSDSSSSDSKGKKPYGSYRLGKVGAISSFRHGAPRPQYASIRPHRTFYAQSSVQYRPSIPPQPLRLPAPYTPPHQVYAAQVVERPPIAHLRPRAPAIPTQQPRQLRHFTPLGMLLGEVLQTLTTAGLLSPLSPRPLQQVVHPHFRMDLHCAYHQGSGHTTDQCTALRHAVQDLIDQGIVHLGQPSIISNPLPTYSTHAIPPPAGGIHSIDFVKFEDRIHMLS